MVIIASQNDPTMYSKSLKPFIIIYGILMAVGLLPFIFLEKGDIVLFINKFSSPNIDNAAVLITHLGDGKTLAAFSIFLAIFVQYRHSLAAFISLIMAGLLTFFLKRVLFSGVQRPRLFFEVEDFYRIIEGKFFLYGSFPSGHTISGFSLFLIIAIIYRNYWLSAFLVLLGALIGLSRIYLLHHFYIDVYFGSIIGVTIPVISYFIVNKWSTSERMNSCLVKSIKKNSAQPGY